MPPERPPEPPGGTLDQAGPSQPRRRRLAKGETQSAGHTRRSHLSCDCGRGFNSRRLHFGQLSILFDLGPASAGPSSFQGGLQADRDALGHRARPLRQQRADPGARKPRTGWALGFGCRVRSRRAARRGRSAPCASAGLSAVAPSAAAGCPSCACAGRRGPRRARRRARVAGARVRP